MADHHQLPPPFACSNCVTERAIVFCFADGARLCLHCDGALHGASALASLHRRAPLCDACHAAPAALRCQIGAQRATLCADCADRVALPDGGASLLQEYTGCPPPAEILRVLSVEAPSSQDDFDAWLADVLPQYLEEIQLFDKHNNIAWWQPQLPPSIFHILSSSYSSYNPSTSSCQPVMTSTTLLQSMGNDYHPSLLLDGFPTFCPALPLISLPPPPENGPGCNDANQPSQMLAADEKAAANHHQQDPSTVSKKREERDRAKQRYYEKKKNRK
uniref:Putative zinc finger protein n=1 Tax=Aegilops tauschii TaxID=37682 RepID=M8CY37_AEGTA